MNSIGCILKPKGDINETTVLGDFENMKLKKSFEKAGDLISKSFNNFIDYLEGGVDIENYNKK